MPKAKAERMRFLLAGGGTGGHIYPALSIGRELKSRYPDAEILFVGGKRGLERDLVPREGFEFKGITVSGFKRKLSFDTFATAFRAVDGLIQSFSIVRRFRPSVVIGTGGYASGPLALAAIISGYPLVIHEQNVVPGATNRVLSRRARAVAISWEESRRFLAHPERAVLTGNPIRAEVLTATREEGLRSFGLDPRRKVVLAFGGSQGSDSINRAFIGAAREVALLDPRTPNGAQMILSTGLLKFDGALALAREAGFELIMSDDGIARAVGGNLILMPYIYNMPQALACADLVVCRSGAITLAELAARGVPAILVPHPYVPDNVQERNARAMEARGASLVMLDKDLSPTALAHEIQSLLKTPERLESMASASRAAGIADATQRATDAAIRAIRP